MTEDPFISYGQNHEDVVLWRVFSGVLAGRYVEVGANHPTDDSITRAFYDRGWSGLTVEPVPAFAALHRAERPRDRQVEAAVTNADADHVTLHMFPGTGLSTVVDEVGVLHTAAGREAEDLTVPTVRLDTLLEQTQWGHGEIHFMVVDVEGAEAQVLSTIDLTVWRPRVLVIEATLPNSTESTAAEWEPGVLEAGYEFCLFDGVSRFYVAKEHREMMAALSYPACALDRFVPAREQAMSDRCATALAELETDHENRILELGARKSRELATLEEVQEEALARMKASLADVTRQLVFWRARSLQAWGASATSVAAAPPNAELAAARAEITRLLEHIAVMEGTVSWRLTAPLRLVRKAQFAITGRRR